MENIIFLIIGIAIGYTYKSKILTIKKFLNLFK